MDQGPRAGSVVGAQGMGEFAAGEQIDYGEKAPQKDASSPLKGVLASEGARHLTAARAAVRKV